MADGSVEIKVEGDAQEFIQSINKAIEAADKLKQALHQVGSNISGDLTNAGNALNNLSGGLDDTADSAGDVGDSLSDVAEGADNLGDSAEGASDATEDLYDIIQEMQETDPGSVGELADSVDDLSDSAGDAGDDLEDLVDDLDDLGDAGDGDLDDLIDDLDELGDSSDDAGDSINSLGDIFKGTFLGNLAANAITAVADGLKDMATQALEAGTNFTSAMSQVGATMGMSTAEIQAGSESFTMLEEAAKVAGSTTAFSATQAAEALNYLALAGYDATTAADTLPAVLNLAAAGGMDLAYASDLATDAMSALGIEAGNENLTHFGDEMAMTASKANTSVAQLGEAILTVGGTAKGLAGGTVELNAALGILANNGIKGAEGGTALRNVILSLTAPTDKAAAKMKDLGIEVNDAQGNMRPLNDIFQDFNASLADMSESEKTNALNEIFNKVDLKSVQALLAGAGEEFDNLAAAIENSGGAMQNMADVQMDNLQGDVTTMQSALEGLQIAIFEKMEGPMRSATQTITGLVSGLQGLITGTTQVNPALAGLAAALTAAFISIPVVQNIGKITTALTTMVGAIKNAGVFLATALANPATLAIAAIAGLIAVIVTLTNKTQELSAEEQALQEYSSQVTSRIEEQSKSFEGLADARSQSVSSMEAEYSKMVAYLSELRSITDENGKVKAGYEGRAEILADYINSIVPGAVSSAQDEAGAYYQVADAVDELIFKKKQEALLNAMMPAYEEALSKQVQAAQDAAQSHYELAKAQERVENLQNRINSGEWGLSGELREAKKDLEEMQNQAEEADRNLQNLQDTINQFETVQAIDASQGLEAAMEQLNAVSAQFSGDIVKFTGDNTAAVEQALGNMATAYQTQALNIAQQWSTMSDTAKAGAMSQLETMRSALDQQAGIARDAGIKVPLEYGNGMYSGIPTLTGQAQEVFETTMRELYPDMSATEMGRLLDAMYASGISGGSGEPVGAAENVTGQVTDTFANADTSVASEAGSNTSTAYADGINSSSGLAVDAAGNLVAQADSTVGGSTAGAGFSTHGSTASSNFASGINGGVGLAVNAAGQLVAQTSSTASSAVAGAGFDSTGQQIPTLIGNAVTGAVETTNSAVRSLVQGTQGVASAAVGSLNFSSIGSMISQGIAGGITSATGFVTGAVRSVISAAKAAAQAAANIASPSKLFRDEVGLYIGQGIAVGITEAESDVDDALQGMVYRSVSHLSKINEQIQDIQVKAAERAAAKELQAHKEAIAEKEKTIKDLEVEAEEKIGEAKAKERAKVEQDYKEKVEKAEKDLLKLQEDWDEKQLQAEEKAQTDRLKNLQEYLQEVKSKQEEFAEKIALGTDELFTREDDDKTFKLLGFQTAIDELTAYQNAIQEIQNRGIDADLMDQVLGMSRDDATEYMNALLNMTDDKFEEYLDGWRSYQEKSKEISEQVYFADSNELDEWVDEFYDTAGSLKDGTKPAGEDAMKALQEGLKTGGQAAIKTAQDIVASINSVFAGMAKMPAFSSRVSSAMAATSSQLATYSGARAGAQSSVAAATTSAVGGMMGSVLSTIAGSANRDIVLNVDGKTLARTTINSFAEVSKQSPAIKNTGR